MFFFFRKAKTILVLESSTKGLGDRNSHKKTNKISLILPFIFILKVLVVVIVVILI